MRKHSSFLVTMPLLMAAAALSSPGAWADGSHSTAQDRVNDSARIVDQMKQDPDLARLIDHSRGVFVVPHYGRGAFIVGGSGGGGVVLARHGGTWSDPAFYNIGGGSIGLQAGGSSGSVALILLTPRAVERFENGGTWSLNANAGLTVANWSDRARANAGKGDVVLWSDTNGLYGGLTASVTKISPDRKLDEAFYQHHPDTRQILMSRVMNPDANALRNALATRVATR